MSLDDQTKQISAHLFDRLFGNKNFIKALPVIIAPSLVYCLFVAIIFAVLPVDVTQAVLPLEANFFLVPIAAVLILLLLRLQYGNSLYFKRSFDIVLVVAVSVFLAFLLSYLGTTVGNTGLLYPLALLFIVMMIFYTIYTVMKPVDTLIQGVNEVASGNLIIEKKGLETYGKEFADLEDAFISMAGELQRIAADIQSAANQLSASSEEMASSTEEVNATSEEISSVMQQMNQGAQQQAELINTAIESVEELSEIARKTIHDISSTVELITDVANQTNMLALNASIEAARAGDYGRGFTVVAENVRRLAEDTKQNSASIQELVDGIQKQILTAVDKIAKSIDSVAAVAEETAASSEEATAATEEQTATMEEMSAASQELASLAQELLGTTSAFRVHENRKQLVTRITNQYEESTVRTGAEVIVDSGKDRNKSVISISGH